MTSDLYNMFFHNENSSDYVTNYPFCSQTHPSMMKISL